MLRWKRKSHPWYAEKTLIYHKKRKKNVFCQRITKKKWLSPKHQKKREFQPRTIEFVKGPWIKCKFSQRATNKMQFSQSAVKKCKFYRRITKKIIAKKTRISSKDCIKNPNFIKRRLKNCWKFVFRERIVKKSTYSAKGPRKKGETRQSIANFVEELSKT